jgi:hypothetical protein
MRKYRTSLAVGFFLGVVTIMSQQMLILFAVFAGRAADTPVRYAHTTHLQYITERTETASCIQPYMYRRTLVLLPHCIVRQHASFGILSSKQIVAVRASPNSYILSINTK